MKRCYTLSKSGNRININTFKRTLYPRLYQSNFIPLKNYSYSSYHPSISKVTKLPWFTRFILWNKRIFFRKNC